MGPWCQVRVWCSQLPSFWAWEVTLTFWLHKTHNGAGPQVGTEGQLQAQGSLRSHFPRVWCTEKGLAGEGLCGRRAVPRPRASGFQGQVHLSGNSTKKAAFRKRPKLQSAVTSQWEWKPGLLLTTHLRTSVCREEGTVENRAGERRPPSLPPVSAESTGSTEP